jgi:methionine-rich copper-binding protein CopC
VKRFWLIMLVLWGTAVSTSRVSAHAELISATPAPGSSVKTLAEIRLVFSEPVGTENQIELLQDFVTAAELQPVLDPNDATVLRAAVPRLPDGVYTVQWNITSADGHPISGSYSLGLNSTLASAAPWYKTTWALLGFLLCGVGVSAFVLRHWRPTSAPKRSAKG